MLLYKFVTWFTDCPYFNFITGWCGIISAATLINFFYFHKPSGIKDTKTASEIVNTLVECNFEKDFIITLLETEDLAALPHLKGQTVDRQKSFSVMQSKSPIGFRIVKTQNTILLYGTLNCFGSPYRLITTSSSTRQLKKLLKKCSEFANSEVSDKDFLENILSGIKKFWYFINHVSICFF